MAKKPVYSFAEGSRLDQDKAQGVGEHVQHLIDANGGAVQPADVLLDAKAKGSPLHSFFNWDDSAAATAYRLEQARHLLRSIKVTFVDLGPEARMARMVVNILPPSSEALADHEPSATYTPIKNALKDPVLRAQILSRALAEAKAWQQRYSDLKELASIFKAIDATTKKGTKK